MTFFRAQMAPVMDGLDLDEKGEPHPRYQLPYPVIVNEDGTVRYQEFWQGTIDRVIGFQKDLSNMRLDLVWREAADNPEAALNMYLVTSDKHGTWGVHTTAVIEFEKHIEPEEGRSE